jgi:hypothetical protein
MKKAILCIFFSTIGFSSIAQVGIGTTSPETSAALELKSTTQGFLLPRMTQVQMNAIELPQKGLTLFCTDCPEPGWMVHNGADYENVITANILAAIISSIVAESNNPAVGGSPSLVDLTEAGIINLLVNQTDYEEAIADATPVPTTLADLQVIINTVNTEAEVATILSVSSNPAAGGSPSLESLTNVGVIDAIESQTDKKFMAMRCLLSGI